MKFCCGEYGDLNRRRRSREGAWIEILLVSILILTLMVAPARERGLKFPPTLPQLRGESRSREGAWIEIRPV